jgi:hypothetical protein
MSMDVGETPYPFGEADWFLENLEDMFDYYHVKPAEAAARKADLGAKLKAA